MGHTNKYHPAAQFFELSMMPAFKLLFTSVLSELKNTTFFKRLPAFLSLKALFNASYIPSASQEIGSFRAQNNSFSLNSFIGVPKENINAFLFDNSCIHASIRKDRKFVCFNFFKSSWRKHSAAFCIKSLHAVSFS